MMKLLLANLALASALSCNDAPDCLTCLGIDGSAPYGPTCGWCASNATVGAVSAHCVDLHSEFDCFDTFSTDQCSPGWECDTSTQQCVSKPGGTSDKATCDKECKNPPTPAPPPPMGKYQCQFTDADPSTGAPPAGQCVKCTNSTDPWLCEFADEGTCQQGCPKYSCNQTTLQCAPSRYGGTQDQCKAQCKEFWVCDADKQRCSKSKNATGAKFDDGAACAQACHPNPLPWELRGIWRGLELHHGYKTGEWLGSITSQAISLFKPNPDGSYSTYIEGQAYSLRAEAQYVLVVPKSKGVLTGEVRMLAADFSMGTEVTGYVNLAIDESAASQVVAEFDIAMTTPTAKVLGMETCPLGVPPVTPAPMPAPTPPPTPAKFSCDTDTHKCVPDTSGSFHSMADCSKECSPKPPPCHAKLDIALLLDGSGSISSVAWKTALKFASDLVDGFEIGQEASAVGVIQFSERTATVSKLTTDKAALKAAIASTVQMKAATNTGQGFIDSKEMLDTQGRPGVNGSLVILLTDGKANMGPDAGKAAAAIRAEADRQIFGIGVGHEVDPGEIKSWVSKPEANYYYSSPDWDQLHKILDGILRKACPPPAAGLTEALWQRSPWLLEERLGSARSLDERLGFRPRDFSQCKFYLPPSLPALEAAVEPFAQPALLQLADPPTGDECNQLPTCEKCIGQHAGGKACGWCTGDVTYKSLGKVGAKCAGKEQGAGSPQWNCTDRFQTTTCSAPTSCGLQGIYRGLRIDNGYAIGEWSATFQPNGQTETADFAFLAPDGTVKTSLSGTMQCTQKCNGANATSFTVDVGGKVLHGLCGFTDQVQAETTGLYIALSAMGAVSPPASWDAALTNKNGASLTTYWKCSDYKAAACRFVKPTSTIVI